MRRLHGPARWRASPILRSSHIGGRRQVCYHHRGPRTIGPPSSRPASFSRYRSLPVRLLHLRHDHEQPGAFEAKSQSHAVRHCTSPARQHLPLRRPSTRHRSRRKSRESYPRATFMSRSLDELTIEPERYEFSSPSLHQFELARRDFFKILGCGIAVFAVARNAAALQETAPGPRMPPPQLPKEIASWLHVGDDGTVTAFTGKVEVGQNARTSLTQSVADELRVPFSTVRMVMGDTELTPFDMGTFGSRTTPTMVPQLRRVAEAARNILIDAAAKQWNVPPASLKAANAKVTDPASGKSFTYAELARGKTLAQLLPDADPITPPSEWTVAGQPLPKVNARDFVTGKHQYTTDLRPESLLYAKILRPPSFAATLASCDLKAASAMPGVVAVVDGNFVGAAASSEAQAERALAGIRAEWKQSPQEVSDRGIFDYLKKNASAESDSPREKQQKGSIPEGLSKAAHKLGSSYTVAYIAHAPLE